MSETRTRHHTCLHCDYEGDHPVTGTKPDGSGFTECPDCEKIQIWTAGTFVATV